jgi:hypothetical protein
VLSLARQEDLLQAITIWAYAITFWFPIVENFLGRMRVALCRTTR